MGKGARLKRLKLLRLAAAPGVKAELSAGTVEEQIGRINELPSEMLGGSETARKLKRKAVSEMDKAIRDFKKKEKEITVETLTHEVKTTSGFLSMSEKIGVPLKWYEDLAKERMEAHKV